MKNFLIRCILSFCVLTVAFFVSCEVANDSLTDEEIATKIVGNWKVSEQPSGTNYEITVSKQGSVNISISGFYNVDISVTATINEGNLIIPEQTAGGYKFKGTGVFSNSFNNITLNYTADDGSGVEQVTNKLTR